MVKKFVVDESFDSNKCIEETSLSSFREMIQHDDERKVASVLDNEACGCIGNLVGI